MAEVTWRATIIGAFVLFLIGFVVATGLMYADVALKSIGARLDGPLNCNISNETIRSRRRCNETRDEIVLNQDCVYLFVSYTNKDTGEITTNIKLAQSYHIDQTEDELVDKIFNPFNSTLRSLYGKCSADYCGTYRFLSEVATETGNGTNYTTAPGPHYAKNPPLIDTVNKARLENGGTGIIECFLNRQDPSSGAYSKLNYEVQSANERMFRYYEGWAILCTPLVIALAILILMAAVFIRGDLTKDRSDQANKEKFESRSTMSLSQHAMLIEDRRQSMSPSFAVPYVPPGLTPIIMRGDASPATSARSAHEASTKEETETLVNHLSV